MSFFISEIRSDLNRKLDWHDFVTGYIRHVNVALMWHRKNGGDSPRSDKLIAWIEDRLYFLQESHRASFVNLSQPLGFTLRASISILRCPVLRLRFYA